MKILKKEIEYYENKNISDTTGYFYPKTIKQSKYNIGSIYNSGREISAVFINYN